MSVLDWQQRGEGCIESIAGDDLYYSIEKIPDSYSWAAWLVGWGVSGKKRLTIGGLDHCKKYCECHYEGTQSLPIAVEAVEGLATAELVSLPTISRRDYFAAMAMQGILSTAFVTNRSLDAEVVTTAVTFADALIEALGDGE